MQAKANKFKQKRAQHEKTQANADKRHANES